VIFGFVSISIFGET